MIQMVEFFLNFVGKREILLTQNFPFSQKVFNGLPPPQAVTTEDCVAKDKTFI